MNLGNRWIEQWGYVKGTQLYPRYCKIRLMEWWKVILKGHSGRTEWNLQSKGI